MTTYELTPVEQEHFERDGYVVRERVFATAEVAALAHAAEALVAGLVEGRHGGRFTVGSYTFEPDLLDQVILKWEGELDVLHGIEPFAHLSPELKGCGLDPRLTEPMRQMVGDPAPELFTEKLNLKRPHHGGPNPLHQDYPYWIEAAADAERVATAIVYLDDTTQDNGCLEISPGSHRSGVHPRRTGTDVFGSYEMDPDANAHLERVPVELPAGSVVMFGAFLAHATGPNRTDQDRRALLYSYQPAGHHHQLDNLRKLAGRA